ncbi:MAG: NAD-dependent malic enzyme [bacterium]|nr:NAD-dependent malic enzyme [bacterium]
MYFETELKTPLNTLDELSLIYTPGVGFSSKEIAKDKTLTNSLTNKANCVGVIFDTDEPPKYLAFAYAVCAIIKKSQNIDAYPLVSTKYDINKIVKNLTPTFGAFYVFSNNEVKNADITEKLDDFDFDKIVKNAKILKEKLEKIPKNKPDFSGEEFRKKALELRFSLNGVLKTKECDLSLEEIKKTFTKENLTKIEVERKNVAIISDGSAVLGLGNIGAYAAMPVMEGKAAIFKALGNVDAFPICIKTQNIDEIIDISTAISYSFGGVNLEDINAPRCFEIEEKLAQRTDIPIFHDDQHGTAIIVLAALLGALKLAGKNIKDVKIVMSGAGAAAQAVAKLILKAGAKNLIMRDVEGVISKNSAHKDKYLRKMAEVTNPNLESGSLADILKGADVLIGLSAANIVSKDMIKSMNEKAIVFVLANPTPEIMPNLAKEAGAFIVATGRSDFENQINNSLAFPGIFKGLLAKNIKKVTDETKYNAALAIANYAAKELSEHKILPKALDKGIVEEIVKTL